MIKGYILTITAESGRVMHICPDDTPIFQASEVRAMLDAGVLPKDAAFMATVKATFPGTFIEKIITPEGEITGVTRKERQMALINFNVDMAPDAMDFDVIPAGNYEAIITDSQVMENKAGTGEYLKLELTIVNGEFEGRKLFENLNLVHPNETTVRIAQGTLKQIAVACGKASGVVTESEELHDIPMSINVSVELRKDNGRVANRIKGYAAVGAKKKAAASRTVAPAPLPAAAAPPVLNNRQAPAWAR